MTSYLSCILDFNLLNFEIFYSWFIYVIVICILRYEKKEMHLLEIIVSVTVVVGIVQFPDIL